MLLGEASHTPLFVLSSHPLINRNVALGLSRQAVRMTVMLAAAATMPASMVLACLLVLLMGLLFLVVVALGGMMRYRNRGLDLS